MLKETKEYIEREYGYKVAYLALYGSQNYNLDTPESDIDLRAIVIPSLTDLVKGNKPVSKTLHINQGKVEQVDVKDIREYLKILKKGNPAYIEPLVTDTYIIDDDFKGLFNYFRENVEEYVRKLEVRVSKATMGMALQKIDRYEKKQDNKDLIHIIRLWLLLIKFRIMHKGFGESMRFVEGDQLFDCYGEMIERVRNGEDCEAIFKNMKSNLLSMKDVIFAQDDFADYSLHAEFMNEAYVAIERSIHERLSGNLHRK